MIPGQFVILGAALSLLGALIYARAVVSGDVRPNRVTWFTWALAPLIAFAAQLADGAGIVAVTTLAVGLGPLLIFCASFARGAGYWRLRPFDAVCGALAVAALAGWQLTGSELLAVALALAADALGAVPTLVKAWRWPQTENGTVFRNAALNGAIGLLALDAWKPANFLFPVYLVIIGTTLWALIEWPRRGAATEPAVRS